jgi:hypothetical protein
MTQASTLAGLPFASSASAVQPVGVPVTGVGKEFTRKPFVEDPPPPVAFSPGGQETLAVPVGTEALERTVTVVAPGGP